MKRRCVGSIGHKRQVGRIRVEVGRGVVEVGVIGVVGIKFGVLEVVGVVWV